MSQADPAEPELTSTPGEEPAGHQAAQAEQLRVDLVELTALQERLASRLSAADS